MTFLATSLLGLLLIFLVVRSRKNAAQKSDAMGFSEGRALKKSARKTTKKSIAPRSPWRATSIVSDADACDAVKAIGSKRFLDSERNIPKLPLQDCDASNCGCKYTRHENRRDETEDRRNPNALQADLYNQTGKTTRRARKRGRRKTDWA